MLQAGTLLAKELETRARKILHVEEDLQKKIEETKETNIKYSQKSEELEKILEDLYHSKKENQ